MVIISGKKRKFINYVHSDSALDLAITSKDGKFLKLILGNESAGKTSILKYHYLKYYNAGYYPVYIAADRISEVSEDKIKALVAKEFRNQYDEIEEIFEQTDFSKIVIFIDDFHKFKYAQGKPVFVHNLTTIFQNVVITGGEFMLFESYTDKEKKSIDLYKDFDTYIIQEFNPSTRDTLITKWYRLGNDYLNDDDRFVFAQNVTRATDGLNEILGKNLIPAHPIFILSYLQALENEEPESTNNKLHAYYYEMLITKSLKLALKDKEDIGFYMTLLKEYCFFLFSEKIRFSPLPGNEFAKFLRFHVSKYSISNLSQPIILGILKNAKIITISSDNNISISYKYLYYFFVAKYLSDNLDRDEIRKIIDLMADRVYRDEYANIILFLSHLSKSPYIITKLIEKSKAIFPSVEPLKLEEDVSFINNLQQELPSKILQFLEVEDARNEELKAADKYEEMEKQFEIQLPTPDCDIEEDIKTLDILSMQAKALRTLNILGQIARKYWGELTGSEKDALAEETFFLALRTLKFYFGLLETASDFLVDHIGAIVQKNFVKETITKEELKTFSANFLFNLSSAVTFGVLKRIVNAIGTEKLSDTFESLQSKHSLNSVNLAITGIKLDHYNSYPTRDVDKLAAFNVKNPLGFATLQNFVIDYLYMYPVTIERKQQICAKLQIKIDEARIIAETSLIKKE